MIRLRLLDDSDMEWVYQLVWHPKVHPWLFWDPHRPSRAGLGATLLATEAGTISQAFACMEGTENVGFATLNHMHPVHRVGSVSFLAIQPGKRKGLGGESVEALLKHGFTSLNLNRVDCRAFVENKPLRRAMGQLGIVCEGIQRQALYQNGEYHDMAVYSMLRSEWEARNAGRRG